MSLLRRSPSPPEPTGDDLFTEAFLKRLEVLAIVSRRVFSGRLRAERRTKKAGSGIEFADHREYAAGDDLRYLDWSVYVRFGKLLLKLYEEEEDLPIYLLVDCSRSMAMGRPPKLDYAKQIVAALAYVGLANLDRIAVTAFDSRVVARMPPTRGQNRIFRVFDFLRELRPDGPGAGPLGGPAGATNLADSIKVFAAQSKRRGVALLVSDLYDPKGFETGINYLRFNKFEPYVLQVFDPSEVRPKLEGDLQLYDCETGETRDVTVTSKVLARYAAAHAEYRKRIEDFCVGKQVPYFAAETSVPFDDLVLSIFRRGGLLQ